MPPAAVLETPRLAVRPADEGDADLFLALWTDPRVMANVGFPRGLGVTREGLLEQLGRQKGSEFDRLLVAVLKATGQPIGECKMHRPDAAGIASTDVKLLPAFWGHRYGIELKRGLLDHLFSRTDCVAVEATPNVGNAASIRMQEAVGGVRMGAAIHEFPETLRDRTVPVTYYLYRVERRRWSAP